MPLFTSFFLLITLSLWTLLGAEETIYVQASAESFNHQALKELLGDTLLDYQIAFCGTPEDTVREAATHKGIAFCALYNTTIAGNYIKPSLEALQTYRIATLLAIHTMKIEMAALCHKDASHFSQIASHPAALLQITAWKNHWPHLKEIPVPEGTAAAGRMLSVGELSMHTAVIGPKELALLYPNLVVFEEGIQDSEDNATTFILFLPEERTSAVSIDRARDEAEDALQGAWDDQNPPQDPAPSLAAPSLPANGCFAL